LFLALELSHRTWRLVFGNNDGRLRHHTVNAGEWALVARYIEEAKQKFGLPCDSRVVSLYEAGRDGFWIHRRLLAMGIDNRVIDSASIEVDRKARRAKTDRIDGEKLLQLARLHHLGQKRLREVRVPAEQDEDRRHLCRERERLAKERRALRGRSFGILALHGIRPETVGGCGWEAELERWRPLLPLHRHQELVRISERLALIETHLRAIERERQRLLTEDESEAVRCVRRLLQLRAVGEESAWVFATECFGWRRFANRRELAASVGITGTPYASGESRREQGITKSGNKRLRRMLVEIAWLWLRHQPESRLSQWYRDRFAGRGQRLARIGIVALARRLLIALWRYLESGIVPEGANLKPARG
jgi:transposase